MAHSLLIAPQWIGDAVMSQPLVARLAARGETVVAAALPWVAPVYRAMPGIAETIELPFAHGRLDLGKRLRLAQAWRGRFSTAYVLPNSIKSALLPWLAGIGQRVGYQGEGRAGLLNVRWPNPGGRIGMVGFYAALADAGSAQQPQPTSDTPRLQLAPEHIAEVCSGVGVVPGRYTVFAPGAEYGSAKRWPTSHFAALARKWIAQGNGPVLLLGSAKEQRLCQDIAAATDGDCHVLAGHTTLDEAMALIAAARAVVSNDSGLMHVAAAFGVPQVALFGSSSPLHTPPLNPRAQVLWLKDELGLDCAPCFARECPLGHTRCLNAISPERARLALQRALQSSLQTA